MTAPGVPGFVTRAVPDFGPALAGIRHFFPIRQKSLRSQIVLPDSKSIFPRH